MVEVDVWADVRCPWCWIGMRRMERARVTAGVPVRARRRSFLLEPQGPARPGLLIAQIATSQWGMSAAEWESTSRRIRDAGRGEGLDINIDGALMFDSNPAHRLLKLAAASEQVDTDAAWESLFMTHFGRNDYMGDPGVLRRQAESWGLDEADADQALRGDVFADEVSADVAEAARLSVRSVPTVIAATGERISATAHVDDLVRFLQAAGAAL